MTEKTGFQSKIDAIQEFIHQLNDGNLTLDQLNELEKNTRELYERSVILRYASLGKNIENKKEEIIHTEETVVEETSKTEENQTEKLEISFDFETKESEETPQEEFVKSDLFEEQKNEIVQEENPIIENNPIVEEAVAPTSIQTTNELFYDSVDLKSAQENTFSVGKLNSLIGSFGLNERLRFINDLFDGDSDQFGEAIKQLDSRTNLNEAKETINYFAKNNDWDTEDESVIDFLLLIQRRYA